MGLIVPRRFNGTSSKFEYAANEALVLGAQSIYVQCVFHGNNAASNNYIIGHCDSVANNGIRINNGGGAGGGITFGCDSTGTTGSPAKSWQTFSLAYGAMVSLMATWDGGLLNSGILLYGLNPGQRNDQWSDWNSGAPTNNGSGAIRGPSGQPMALGGRTGGTTRISDFDLYRLARWNRMLTFDESEMVHYLGVESVPVGLVFNWYNGADWGPYHLTAPSILDINPGTGKTSYVVPPFDDGDDEDEWFPTPTAAELLMGQACL